MLFRWFIVLFVLCPLGLLAQEHEHGRASRSHLKFIENQGQWLEAARYRAEIPGGHLFLTDEGLRFNFKHEEDMARIHDIHHGQAVKGPEDYVIRGHAYAVSFVNGQTPRFSGRGKNSDYFNFFLGNDESKWRGNVPNFQGVLYTGVYPGIDFHIYGHEAGAKYDFIVHAGADANQIALAYEGLDRLALKRGQLEITTSVNRIIEDQPIAYQERDGVREVVPCRYQLKGKTVSFDFPKGYDRSLDLVIDPSLIFVTYSGATADNWGYTATYDAAGNLYAGGVVFNDNTNSYPTTTGAYQTTFQGGEGISQVDMIITKFNSTGSSLLYSTYLGGSGNESPHSLVVNDLNQLAVLGSTSSANYPVSAFGFDQSFGGGTGQAINGISYASGADIVVTKFNALGTGLVGSTFVGGSSNDGLQANGNPLSYNYGDPFRGEIITDAAGNIYVASVSSSANDFPLVNAFQSNYGGGQHDGVVFKMNPTLTSMTWSSYIGGNGADAVYSLQLNSLGEVCVTGGTSSTNLSLPSGGFNSNTQGGTDGFAMKVAAAGGSLTAGTFVGTGSYDQSFFIQVDSNDAIYVVGQTEGNYPVSAGTYSNPNSGQFLHKFSSDLSTSLASTVIGTGSGDVDLVLTAFLVNDCHNVFVAGWGGALNGANFPASTTTGLPTTPNATNPTTDGSDFYFMVLSADFQDFLFGTFMGGTGSNEHVDGGTCRFDKQGIVYHSVCAGCGGNSNFAGTPGAYSTTNGSFNCNLAAFKYDFATLNAQAITDGPSTICLGDSIGFLNLSVGGAMWQWDFGDGTSSSTFEPQHVFQTAGTYNVFLAIVDSVSCSFSDTAWLTVNVLGSPLANADTVPFICQGDSIQLHASGGTNYQWFPAIGLSDPLSPNPMAAPNQTTLYSVIVFDSCLSDTATVLVRVHPGFPFVGPDDQICVGQSVSLFAGGGNAYSWTPTTGLSDPNTNDPLASPTITTTYTVVITDSNNCSYSGDVTIFVDTNNLIMPSTLNDTTICLGDSAYLQAFGATEYRWGPPVNLSDRDNQWTWAWPPETRTYYVDISNVCGTVRDSMTVYVNILDPQVTPDTIVCPGEQVQLEASGGNIYRWSPKVWVSDWKDRKPIADPPEPATFEVEVIDGLNCTVTRKVTIDWYDQPRVYAGKDVYLGTDSVVLEAIADEGSTIIWSPPDGLSCTTCNPTVARPKQSTYYYAQVIDVNGCVSVDSLLVDVESAIYVPNTFSPNNEFPNDIFKAEGIHVFDVRMKIFSRWGQQIYSGRGLENGWDGSFKGVQSPIGMYIWQIWYTDITGRERFITGHVNLIR